MEKFHGHEIFVQLLHLLLVLLLSLQCLSSDYTPPSKYFINCGSSSNISDTRKTFVGDESSDSFTLYPKQEAVEDNRPSPATSQLYRTARLFRSPSSYEFDIDQIGIYLQSSSHKGILLTVNISKFIVKFEPSQELSFAFVNAIEVFIAPDSFIPDSALLVTPAGSNNSSYKDDPYLFNKSAARNQSVPTETSYQQMSGYNDSTPYIAPPLVYMSAKEMNKSDSDPLQFFNISWGFDVSKNARHLLRVHFCDFISISGSFNPWLNLYIYSFFSQKIDNIPLGAPFFLDLLVVSDDSGFLNVTIGPQIDSPVNNSFLNGLEIMIIMEELGWVSMENESKKKTTPLLIGLVVGGLALVCIVIIVLSLRLKCRKEKPAEASHCLPVTVDGGLSSHSRVIQSATNNFSRKLLVGKGGFGKVYQGTLRNGMKVAVKRSQPGHGQGLPEFQTEILVLSKIRHATWDSEKSSVWFRFAVFILEAKAVNLHWCSKGISLPPHRSGLPHQTHVSTAVKGTFGYLDPEYFRTQQLTDKSDVYSFGVVLLEKKGLLEQVIDPLLVGKVNLNSLRKFGETAEKCLKEDSTDRPTMGDVMWDLEYAFQLQQTAMQREPLEDSTNDAASTFPLPTIQHYPSYSFSISDIHGPKRRVGSSETTESEVFSQLRIADGR
ncbi:putative receptor-like protein kinase [Vitis vinifera]|uniref:Putative receptor-like protein kinase n=1 Tax=Vitis vinifera TaxID=29760 RepID=A0A438KPL6_VITVI|nr:putative receptor-like protein kinase [Vitis vinifera]